MIEKKVKKIKGLVLELRKIRDQMNVDLENMSSEERLSFFEKLQAKKQHVSKVI